MTGVTVITESALLAEYCSGWQDAEYVTVDTEFMREKTYWPILCLIQVGGPDESVVIDPLVEGIDLQPLYDLLINPNVLKVFHAARQDVEDTEGDTTAQARLDVAEALLAAIDAT